MWRYRTITLVFAFLILVLGSLPASGQIYNWDTGQVIPGTEGITPGPGLRLSFWDTDQHNLRYADLSGGLDLHGSEFVMCGMEHVRFMGANLSGSLFDNVFLDGADFRGADLSNVYFYVAVMPEADFRGANLQNAFGEGVNLGKANLRNANLHDASFPNAVLTNADLSGSILTGAGFVNAPVDGASFTQATVAAASFSRYNPDDNPGKQLTAAQLYSTASYPARDLRGIGLANLDLTGWQLANQDLTGANFEGATLTGTDLSGAEIGSADFSKRSYGYRSYGTGLTAEQLYSTASYQARDLHGIGLRANDLSGWDLANQNLMGADFTHAGLRNADLGGAIVAGARFHGHGAGELTKEQLYSTASYQAGDLHAIRFYLTSLNGWNLAGQSLTGAEFLEVTLADTRLELADLRAAQYVTPSELASAITRGTILPDGHIAGLDLGAGETLKIHDYDGDPSRSIGPIAIHVTDAMNMGTDGALKMILEADAWDSTISFDAGIPVALGGTLELTFAPGVNVAGQIGRTFDLFDWTGVSPTGAFSVSSLHDWDISNLYTTGEVTLITPEPASAALLALGFLVLRRRRR